MKDQKIKYLCSPYIKRNNVKYVVTSVRISVCLRGTAIFALILPELSENIP